MNEKEAITSVIAIGENTHRYLEKIKELMYLEKTDVHDWKEMFEKSPDELKAFGEKASERARKDHDRDENLKTLIKIYKDITV